jgi:hypothetical protein
MKAAYLALIFASGLAKADEFANSTVSDLALSARPSRRTPETLAALPRGGRQERP